MLNVQIGGLGHYLPRRIVTNDELAQRLGCSSAWIEKTTGVQRRHWCEEESTACMAVEAARMAALGIPGGLQDCDLVVSASTAPEQAIPCTASIVAQRLQFPPSQVFAFDVNATCISFLTALQVAGALIDQRLYRTALIFSSEIASVSLDLQKPENSVLFGDAAGAAILTRTPDGASSRILHSVFATFPEGNELAQYRGAGTRHPPNARGTAPEMNTFQMHGPAIFKLAMRTLGDVLDRLFAEIPWQRGDVDFVVPHQALGWGVEQLWRRFGFRPEQVLHNIADRGNCVAASIPLLFSEAVAANRIRRGDRVILVGTAAGFSIGAMALVY